VVAKLFNITMPHLAVFGEKDNQQLQVIRRMVKDLNMDIEIMGVPTVREPDGLAMSSRNNYLSPKERKAALCLKRALDISNDMFNRGIRDAGTIKDTMESLILKQPYTKVEYISLCDPLTLEEVTVLGDTTLVALAVRIGKTRLIDNSLLQK
jgi:pantoate--beta-alanine ligase